MFLNYALAPQKHPKPSTSYWIFSYLSPIILITFLLFKCLLQGPIVGNGSIWLTTIFFEKLLKAEGMLELEPLA